MRTNEEWQETIHPGFHLFGQEGGEEFGAVRDVCPDGRSELLVNIENGGDHCIPLSSVVDVHDQKVVVDVEKLPPPVRSAVAHAHDAEEPGL